MQSLQARIVAVVVLVRCIDEASSADAPMTGYRSPGAGVVTSQTVGAVDPGQYAMPDMMWFRTAGRLHLLRCSPLFLPALHSTLVVAGIDGPRISCPSSETRPAEACATACIANAAVAPPAVFPICKRARWASHSCAGIARMLLPPNNVPFRC